MSTEEQPVQHTRMLQSFEDFRDCELVYGALEAARHFVQRTDPSNLVLGLIKRAVAHRDAELRDTYEAQSRGRNPAD